MPRNQNKVKPCESQEGREREKREIEREREREREEQRNKERWYNEMASTARLCHPLFACAGELLPIISTLQKASLDVTGDESEGNRESQTGRNDSPTIGLLLFIINIIPIIIIITRRKYTYLCMSENRSLCTNCQLPYHFSVY